MTDANVRATPILNYQDPGVQSVIATLGASQPAPRRYAQAAHTHVADVMRPVYSIDERVPVPDLLRINRGSCSQRMACVEALARGYGIGTRVRALWLDRTFWYFRLPLLRPLLPKKLLMPWPQFWIDGHWVDFDEIYGSTADLAAKSTHAFTNHGESLFDAVQHTPVDFLGKSLSAGCPGFSLAKFVVEDGGFFDTRDELLEKLDHTGWIGRLIFNVTYGNRPVRRAAERV